MRSLLFLCLSLVLVPVFVAGQNYASESVLNTGNWYKIGVTQTGVHKIDAAFLSSMGISPGSIDPRNIQIYGNGGRMLPQLNSAFRHDDLVENAILVEGESDGQFGGGDYVLFYGEGPHTWQKSCSDDRLSHLYHAYADTNYYFLRIGNGPGKRIEEIASAAAPTFTVTKTQGLIFHEIDSENLIKSGRSWLGEKFDLITERFYTYHLPDMATDGQIRVNVRVAARSDKTTAFNVYQGNTLLGTMSLSSTDVSNSDSRYYVQKQSSFTLDPAAISTDDSLRIRLEYDKKGSSRSEGWLDWMEVDYDKGQDTQNAEEWAFTLIDQVGPGAVADFSIKGSNAYRIWDVTNPVWVESRAFSMAGDQMVFAAEADSFKRYIAFREASLSPVSSEPVVNQNLHGMALVDYLIITHPSFVSEAERLADFHRNHYKRSAAVVTVPQIFNEFSSGKQDVSAIRDFIRMFYVRSGGMSPGFVMMFGDGTYIYKHINASINNATNFVPTYQSRDSWDPTDSYTSDDFFVLLEENEGFWGENAGICDFSYQVNTLDVPIGRLPIEDIDQAKGMVDKIIRYAENPNGSGLGAWRNKVALVADHKEGEGSIHVRQADGYSPLISASNACINLDKIYMDNYPMETTAGVTRFPEGRKALLNTLDQGGLIINYTGHGGEYAWSNSRILEVPDIESMKNEDRLPIVVTATCEFGRFDDPDRRSGAEIMTMNPQTGAIALFTTVRLVYSSPNATLNQNFYRNVFTYDAEKGRMPTLGEVMMRTKNSTFVRGNLANINSRNFTLLGDPGLILNYPELSARVTTINGEAVSPGNVDTLRSLSRVTVSGIIEDLSGNQATDFNGEMNITVFDKPSRFTTRLSNFSFNWQKNRIFNGRTEVKDGTFSFEFVVPIDISYENGDGKISLYFFNEETDGSGCHANLFIGGTDVNAPVDDQGPEISLFMNDENWISGGTTSPDPLLYAIVSDENGINTVGSGIGHEITGVLDEDEASVLILNDFYTAKLNSYQEGTVRYQLEDLSPGEHTLRVRVWDVANNAAEAETRFIVSDNAAIALDQILNYPNPFTESTEFRIGHNQSGKPLRLKVDIFTTEGKLVKTLSSEFFAVSGIFDGLEWDGTNEAGSMLGSGVYLYRVALRDTDSGREINQMERLVIIR